MVGGEQVISGYYRRYLPYWQEDAAGVIDASIAVETPVAAKLQSKEGGPPLLEALDHSI
jgi:hypothetical protein